MATTTQDTRRAESQARAKLESIKEMVKALDDDEAGRDDAIDAIHEDPLSVAVRSGWYTLAESRRAMPEPEEYMILLCTGGPAVRIIGELGRYNEPESATIQYQDWFTPWVELPLGEGEEETVLTYAQQFYFGS